MTGTRFIPKASYHMNMANTAPPAPREHAQSYALRFPGAYAEHPWVRTAIKVNKKVFLYAARRPRRVD